MATNLERQQLNANAPVKVSNRPLMESEERKFVLSQGTQRIEIAELDLPALARRIREWEETGYLPDSWTTL